MTYTTSIIPINTKLTCFLPLLLLLLFERRRRCCLLHLNMCGVVFFLSYAVEVKKIWSKKKSLEEKKQVFFDKLITQLDLKWWWLFTFFSSLTHFRFCHKVYIYTMCVRHQQVFFFFSHSLLFQLFKIFEKCGRLLGLQYIYALIFCWI